MISTNTEPEDILANARDGVEESGDKATNSDEWIGPYAARYQERRVPAHHFPQESSKAQSAYQVHRPDFALSDGRL